MTTQPASSNHAATVLAFLALLISIISFVWVGLDKVFPGTVIAHKVSLQNRDDSTRFSISLDNNLPVGSISFDSGARVRFEAETVDSTPCITIRRTDTGEVGVLRCVFPAVGPPFLQQLDAAGAVIWTAPAPSPSGL